MFCERVVFRDAYGQPLCPAGEDGGGDGTPAFSFGERQRWLHVPRRCTFHGDGFLWNDGLTLG